MKARIITALFLTASIAFGADSLTEAQWSAAMKRPVFEATNLIAAYGDNEIAMDRAAKGKAAAIHGKITLISRDILGLPFVVLNNGIRCSFQKEDEAKLAQLNTGQNVTVVGEVRGKTLGLVSLHLCVLWRVEKLN